MATGELVDRLRMRLDKGEGLRSLDKVVQNYGYVEGERFTFKDHEYQIDIIRDTSFRLAVQKCSQVGLSELMVQKTLGILGVMPNIRIIFSLPTKEMAMAFSKDRFDGAITQSDHYSAMVGSGDNSASQKKLGQSLLYVIGTFGAKSAISVPAEFIISDEVDFSNPIILGKLESRIRHAKSVDEKGNRGYRYRFSTPTHEGFGINIDFLKGDQRYYMCRCEHCNKFVLPSFYRDLILPGFTKDIKELRKDDIDSNRYDVDNAWIKCPECGKNLFASLCNPERREWVAKHPENWDHSYQVFPWDVPKYNSPSAILRQMSGYPLLSDFMNFVIGLPYSDADNSFLTGIGHKAAYCTLERWIFGQYIVNCPTFGGMDVGKLCHMIVAAKIGTKVHVVAAEKIENTRDNPAAPQVLARYDYYRMHKLCIDAGPDISLVNALLSAREGIQSVVYVNEIKGPVPIKAAQDDKVINADRTKTLSLLLADHNNGDILYMGHEQTRDEIFDHLATTKKQRAKEADGSLTEKFIKTDKNDHWVHGLNYMRIAILASQYLGEPAKTYAMPMVGAVQVGNALAAQAVREGKKEPSLLGLFGIGGTGGRGRR
jgi:hypothetical protein